VKKTVKILGTTVLVAVVVLAWNYFAVFSPAIVNIKKDGRNKDLSVWVYHRFAVNPKVLVFDLRSINGKAAPLDVMRALLQGAEALKDKSFHKVILAYEGKEKFYLEGAFFKNLGFEFGTQNPIYTLRTLPQNVRKLDGTSAYGTWTGGLFGVVARQMEDLSQFSKDWFLTDALLEADDEK
jgi:hypothetical protein